MPRTIKDQIFHVFLRLFQTPGRETAGRALTGRSWLLSVLRSWRVQRTEVGAAVEPPGWVSVWTFKRKVCCGLYVAPLHPGEFSGSEDTSATWLRNQLKRTPREWCRITACPFLTALVGWAELLRTVISPYSSCLAFMFQLRVRKHIRPWHLLGGLDSLLCLKQLLRIDPCHPEPRQRRQQPQLLWLADYDHGDHSTEALQTMPANPPPFAFTGTTWEMKRRPEVEALCQQTVTCARKTSPWELPRSSEHCVLGWWDKQESRPSGFAC